MISVKQIRAGRALLDWSQKELADKTGISLRALANIEVGNAVPRSSTEEFIRLALEQGGVEFLSADGVRLKEEVLEILSFEGQDALRMMFSDILNVLPDGGELVGINLNEKYFFDHGGEYLSDFYDKMKCRNIRERLLIRRGDKFLITEKSSYRWLRPDLFTEVPFVVYGNTVMQILWGDKLKLILIRNDALARAYKKQFEIYWEKESEALP
ncbi:MAG TPA: helix-turn-helix domain-containing protein [Alphaproteobacteria bacterium]|nr:helix-turn-helix domain-containing protein [Alphaproteobacteria bacterium]HOO51871.1 helix-turn-helix domain-containing protein [Alphaproteobacteria bacterium]